MTWDIFAAWLLENWWIVIIISVCMDLLVFLIGVIIIRWIFRINDIADALRELAYYKKVELEERDHLDFR